MTRRIKRDDRGAVLVIMTICLSVVLLGVAAIAFNTGSWYAERAQLQNGADAAALAVAQSCTAGTCQGSYTLPTDLAVAKANSNANDNKATVDYVCGGSTTDTSGAYTRVTGISGLATCGTGLANWTSTGCPAPPSTNNTGFVNVHVSTKTDSGSSLPVIGGLNGKPEHIKACAQAELGYPGSGDVAPFTLSACEYYYATGATGIPPTGATFANKPAYTSTSQLPNAYPAVGGKYNPDSSPALTRPSEIVVPLHGTANLLQGGSWDTGTRDSWSGSPNNTNGPTLTPVLASSGAPTFNSTAGSLQVTWSTGNATAALKQTVSVSQNQMNSGEFYTLTGWVYATSTTSQPRLVAYANNPAVAANQGAPVTLVANTWTQISVTFKAPSSNNTVGIANLDAVTAATTFYMDEFSLAPTVNPQCAGTPTPTNPPSGYDMSGGFGWISDPSGCNNINISVNNTAWDNTGASLPSGCNSVLSSHTCSASTIISSCQPSPMYVPVYDYVCNNNNGCNVSAVCGTAKPAGSNGCYHFVAFAAFIPTGFKLNGGGGGGLQQSSFISNKNYCSGSSKCVYGYYVEQFDHLPNGGGGGENFGLSFFSLSG